jgi:hypothetical protein
MKQAYLYQSQSEIARLKALEKYATSENGIAQALAVKALETNNTNSQNLNIAAPQDPVFKWVSLFLPTLSSVYAIHSNAQVQATSLKYNSETSQAMFSAFTNFGNKSQQGTVVNGTAIIGNENNFLDNNSHLGDSSDFNGTVTTQTDNSLKYNDEHITQDINQVNYQCTTNIINGITCTK